MFTKFFRAITLIVASIVTMLVAVQPQVARAQIVYPVNHARYFVVEVPHRSINPVKYTVRQGDSLTRIAELKHVAWQSLYCFNKTKIGNNPDVIVPGERITIPLRKITCHIAVPAVAIINTTNTETTSSVPSNQPPVTVVSTPPQETLTQVQQYALGLLNGDETQYACLAGVIAIESSWNTYAQNPSSGAYGIPQALPGSKMAIAGADWATNPDTQLRWMILDYIAPVYGTPCGALQHEHDAGWY